MKYLSYMAPESVVEGFDAGMVFPSFNSTPSYGEEVVVVANASSGVVGYVIKFTNKVPNYIARRTFVEKPEVRKRSKYEGLSGIPIKKFIIPNVTLSLIEGGKVRNEDKPIIDAAIEELLNA